MVNFASLDPTIDRAGMSHASKLDKIVWDKFIANIDFYLSEQDDQPSGFCESTQAEYEPMERVGIDVEATVTQRRGQAFFRSMILASYDCRCALSEIDAPELLVASHIAPWFERKNRRLDPTNGICLNAIFDRAFDRGLIAFSGNYQLLFSTELSEQTKLKLQNMSAGFLRLPSRFRPDPDLFRQHRERFGHEYVI